jgi:hypothetical protein
MLGNVTPTFLSACTEGSDLVDGEDWEGRDLLTGRWKVGL